MQLKSIFLLGVFFCFLAAMPVFADEQPQEQQKEQPQATQETKTGVVVNEEAGTVSIVVNGNEVAVFNDKGLHIEGNIEHTGYVTDTTSHAKQVE